MVDRVLFVAEALRIATDFEVLRDATAKFVLTRDKGYITWQY